MVGGGLFPSPPVTKKSPTPTEKSPTVISKRCWTLEYSGELEFSSPFMEQWTLDARGVLYFQGGKLFAATESFLPFEIQLTRERLEPVGFTTIGGMLEQKVGSTE